MKEIQGGQVPLHPAPYHTISGNDSAPPALGAGYVRLAVARPTHFILCESVKI